VLQPPGSGCPPNEEDESRLFRGNEHSTSTRGVSAEDRDREALGDVALHRRRRCARARAAAASGCCEREEQAADGPLTRVDEVAHGAHAHEAYETPRMITRL
jgi:hypothetical protein